MLLYQSFRQMELDNIHCVDRPYGRRLAFIFVSSVCDQRHILESFASRQSPPSSAMLALQASVMKPGYGALAIAKVEFSSFPLANARDGSTDPSTEKVCPRSCCEFYVQGEKIGNETRNLEFKSGQGQVESHLGELVGKYMSAFLNCEGGTLMIGVNDAGGLFTL